MRESRKCHWCAGSRRIIVSPNPMTYLGTGHYTILHEKGYGGGVRECPICSWKPEVRVRVGDWVRWGAGRDREKWFEVAEVAENKFVLLYDGERFDYPWHIFDGCRLVVRPKQVNKLGIPAYPGDYVRVHIAGTIPSPRHFAEIEGWTWWEVLPDGSIKWGARGHTQTLQDNDYVFEVFRSS